MSKETMSEGVGSVYAAAGGKWPLFTGEAPAKGDLERWIRDYAKAESADVMTALRGGVPAKLAADTQPFDNLLLEAGGGGCGLNSGVCARVGSHQGSGRQCSESRIPRELSA